MEGKERSRFFFVVAIIMGIVVLFFKAESNVAQPDLQLSVARMPALTPSWPFGLHLPEVIYVYHLFCHF